LRYLTKIYVYFGKKSKVKNNESRGQVTKHTNRKPYLTYQMVPRFVQGWKNLGFFKIGF